jgi:hypothetical protein
MSFTKLTLENAQAAEVSKRALKLLDGLIAGVVLKRAQSDSGQRWLADEPGNSEGLRSWPLQPLPSFSVLHVRVPSFGCGESGRELLKKQRRSRYCGAKSPVVAFCLLASSRLSEKQRRLD